MVDLSFVNTCDDIATNLIKNFEEVTGKTFGVGSNCDAKGLVEFYDGKVRYRNCAFHHLYKGPGKQIVYVISTNQLSQNEPESVAILRLLGHFLLNAKSDFNEYELGEIIYPNKDCFINPNMYIEYYQNNKQLKVTKIKEQLKGIESGKLKEDLIEELKSYGVDYKENNLVKRKRYKVKGHKISKEQQ